jgi:ankyrin repeat protein
MNKYTEAILFAIKNNDLIEMKKILCEIGGAHVLMNTDEGKPPLLFAVESGNLPAVQLLVEFNARVNWMGAEQKTLCSIARMRGFHEIADYLEPLIDKDLQEISDSNTNEFAFKENILINIMKAIDNGDAKMVKKIIGEGIDVNARFEEGITPLMHAAYVGNMEIVKILVNNGADVDLFDSQLETALSCASHGDHEEIVNYLAPLTSIEIREMVEQQLNNDF